MMCALLLGIRNESSYRNSSFIRKDYYKEETICCVICVVHFSNAKDVVTLTLKGNTKVGKQLSVITFKQRAILGVSNNNKR